MTSNWKAVVGVFLVFIFGCFAGGLSTSLVFHHQVIKYLQGGPAATVEALEHKLTHKLDLDPDQRQKIDAAFQDNLKERMILQARIKPEMQMANLKTYQEISAVLRPEQAEQFERNLKKLHQQLGQGAFKTNPTSAEGTNPPVAGTPSGTNGDAAPPAPAK